jgi:hypothetical protein
MIRTIVDKKELVSVNENKIRIDKKNKQICSVYEEKNFKFHFNKANIKYDNDDIVTFPYGY